MIRVVLPYHLRTLARVGDEVRVAVRRAVGRRRLIWAGIIAFAVMAYVVLDGFDLGIGLLFPLLKPGSDRSSQVVVLGRADGTVSHAGDSRSFSIERSRSSPSSLSSMAAFFSGLPWAKIRPSFLAPVMPKSA